MLQVPNFIKKRARVLIFRRNKLKKNIYLTFDDGPNPIVTPLILDILEKYNCKATFFCVGENVTKYPEIYQEIIKRGHSVGNHTYNHLKGFRTPTKKYIENVEKADKIINSRWFRPPYGRITPIQIHKLKKKYKLVMWDIITYDYDKKISPNKIIKEIENKSRNGSIVVFHDSIKAKKNVLATLPKALEFWNTSGYLLKTFE